MNSEQILILEDDSELNRGLCTAFKNDGKQVVSVRTIKAAKEQIEIQTPALALLDVNLPDGSGLDLLKWIRSVKPASTMANFFVAPSLIYNVRVIRLPH